MPARKPAGRMTATRAPEGAGRARYDGGRPGVSSSWPGYFDDGDGQCTCSWSVLNGVRQVKFANSGCPVRHQGRRP